MSSVKNILLINQGKSENLGDKAIMISLKNELESLGHNVIISGYTQMTEQHIGDFSINQRSSFRDIIKKNIPHFLVWYLKYKPLIKKVSKAKFRKDIDYVIIGGGQLLKTNSVFPYALLSWIKNIRLYSDAKIILLGVGIDDSFGYIDYKIYEKYLKKVDRIYVRDNTSREIIKETFGIDSDIIPDVAYSYNFTVSTCDALKEKVVVMIYDYNTLVNHFNWEISREEYYDEWIGLMKNECQGDSEYILAYTTIGDKRESYRFFDYISELKIFNSVEICRTDTLIQLEKLYSESKKVITGRMHAMILADICGLEIVPYVVSSKIESYVEDYLKKERNIDFYKKEIRSILKKI